MSRLNNIESAITLTKTGIEQEIIFLNRIKERLKDFNDINIYPAEYKNVPYDAVVVYKNKRIKIEFECYKGDIWRVKSTLEMIESEWSSRGLSIAGRKIFILDDNNPIESATGKYIPIMRDENQKYIFKEDNPFDIIIKFSNDGNNFFATTLGCIINWHMESGLRIEENVKNNNQKQSNTHCFISISPEQVKLELLKLKQKRVIVDNFEQLIKCILRKVNYQYK